MAKQGPSGIAWTEETHNPVRGCERVSPGCMHCYAEEIAARFSGEDQPYEGLATRTKTGAHWTGAIRLLDEKVDEIMRWKRSRLVFMGSMSDIFHKDVPTAFIQKLLHRCVLAGHQRLHIFQFLTKRAERMRDEVARYCDTQGMAQLPWFMWMGISAEDQEWFDRRWPVARDVRAQTRWISFEPLLGPIDLQSQMWEDLGEFVWPEWAVVGGESGAGARAMDVAWCETLASQCKEIGIRFFMKQGSENNWPDFKNFLSFPAHLQIRDYPRCLDDRRAL